MQTWMNECIRNRFPIAQVDKQHISAHLSTQCARVCCFVVISLINFKKTYTMNSQQHLCILYAKIQCAKMHAIRNVHWFRIELNLCRVWWIAIYSCVLPPNFTSTHSHHNWFSYAIVSLCILQPCYTHNVGPSLAWFTCQIIRIQSIESATVTC